jgi:hypothetical protein
MAGQVYFAKGTFPDELPERVVTDVPEIFGGELSAQKSARWGSLKRIEGGLTRGAQSRSLQAVVSSMLVRGEPISKAN